MENRAREFIREYRDERRAKWNLIEERVIAKS